MSNARPLPLFDRASSLSWDERMIPGECAVHYSSFVAQPASGLYCTVFGSLAEAEAYARQQVAERPTLRCTIYGHEGKSSRLREIRGAEFKMGSEISPHFRRWVGSVLFFGGALLMGLDWSLDFKLSWPSLIGARMLIPGTILVVTEAILLLHARADRRRVAGGETV